MDDLVTWLRAQLDDEERVARAAGGDAWAASVEYYEYDHDLKQAEHIARQDPAATLARVEAHRQIVDEHDWATVWATDEEEARPSEWEEPEGPQLCPSCEYQRQPCKTLRLLASAYAHLPGYREEWKP